MTEEIDGELTVDHAHMGRVMRHLLRNHCAGIGMVVSAIKSRGDDYISSKSDLVLGEVAKLERFTTRFNNLLGALPEPLISPLETSIIKVRKSLEKLLPGRSFNAAGDESLVIDWSNWLEILLEELLANALEAAGTTGTVELGWEEAGGLLNIVIVNTGSSWPESVPFLPPEPFCSTRSGYNVGLGLGTAWKICHELGGDLVVNTEHENMVAVQVLGLPLKRPEAGV